MHGEQHYRAIEHWGGEEAFKQRLKLDEIKRKFCIDNSIALVILKHSLSYSKVQP